jgi:hypothetical protein
MASSHLRPEKKEKKKGGEATGSMADVPPDIHFVST